MPKGDYCLISAPDTSLALRERIRQTVENAEDLAALGLKLYDAVEACCKVAQAEPDHRGRFEVTIFFIHRKPLVILCAESQQFLARHNALVTKAIAEGANIAALQEQADREGWDA